MFNKRGNAWVTDGRSTQIGHFAGWTVSQLINHVRQWLKVLDIPEDKDLVAMRKYGDSVYEIVSLTYTIAANDVIKLEESVMARQARMKREAEELAERQRREALASHMKLERQRIKTTRRFFS